MLTLLLGQRLYYIAAWRISILSIGIKQILIMDVIKIEI